MNEILSAICITISAFLLFMGMIEIYINMNDKKDKKSFIFNMIILYILVVLFGYFGLIFFN